MPVPARTPSPSRPVVGIRTGGTRIINGRTSHATNLADNDRGARHVRRRQRARGGITPELALTARVVASIVIVLLASSPVLAQNSTAHRPGAPRRILWTVAGAGGGFGIGLFVGLNKFDDAINSERKVWTSAIVGAAAGGAIAWWLTRPRSASAQQSRHRCPKMLAEGARLPRRTSILDSCP